jgi:ferredoxin
LPGMETDGIKELLQSNLNHPRWDDVAQRCLSCANCTMVCPTCFCTRSRRWLCDSEVRGHRDVVTVVGHAATIAAGEWITASGEWINDRTHGQQFKAQFLRTSPPTSVDGIEKYLSSGMIRGVGPVYAKKLVHAFGEKVFDIIKAMPDRLREVGGIGRVRAASDRSKLGVDLALILHPHYR